MTKGSKNQKLKTYTSHLQSPENQLNIIRDNNERHLRKHVIFRPQNGKIVCIPIYGRSFWLPLERLKTARLVISSFFEVTFVFPVRSKLKFHLIQN